MEVSVHSIPNNVSPTGTSFKVREGWKCGRWYDSLKSDIIKQLKYHC